MIYKAYGVGQAFLTRAFWGAVAPMSKNVAQVHLVNAMHEDDVDKIMLMIMMLLILIMMMMLMLNTSVLV